MMSTAFLLESQFCCPRCRFSTKQWLWPLSKCDREGAAAVSHSAYQNGTWASHPGLHLILQLSYKRLSDKNFLSTCMCVRWASTGLLALRPATRRLFSAIMTLCRPRPLPPAGRGQVAAEQTSSKSLMPYKLPCLPSACRPRRRSSDG